VGVAPPVMKILKNSGLVVFKPSVEIYALRITPTGISPPQPTHFCQALEWAVHKGIQIAIFSFGGPVSGYIQFEADCIKKSLQQWAANNRCFR
jgi:hypothetical protein